MLLRFLLISFITIPLYSQNSQQTISGEVLDNLGLPLLGANISLDNNVYGTIADDSGTYILKNVTAGNHTIKVSLIGFKTHTKNITISKNEDFTLNFLST